MRSIRSYRLTHPSGVLGLKDVEEDRAVSAMDSRRSAGEITHGKNSKLHHGLPSRSAFLILSEILTIRGGSRESEGKREETGSASFSRSVEFFWHFLSADKRRTSRCARVNRQRSVGRRFDLNDNAVGAGTAVLALVGAQSAL